MKHPLLLIRKKIKDWAVFLLPILFGVMIAYAGADQKHIWDGGDEDGPRWSYAGNWDTDLVPAVTDEVFFDDSSMESGQIKMDLPEVTNVKTTKTFTGTIRFMNNLTVTNIVSLSGGTIVTGSASLKITGTGITVGSGATIGGLLKNITAVNDATIFVEPKVGTGGTLYIPTIGNVTIRKQ